MAERGCETASTARAGAGGLRSPLYGRVPERAKTQTVFKVHKTVLALNSPIFRDMLSLPEVGESETDTFDGVPLVYLPDNAHDLETLLAVLYHTK